MKNKILFLGKYDVNGASSRLRFYQYTKMLESDGYEVTVKPFFSKLYLERLYRNEKSSVFYLFKCYIKRFFTVLSVFKYDVVLVEKEIFPYLPSIFEFLFVSLSKKYIVDFDDAVFLNYSGSFFLRNKYNYLLANSSCVFVGNNYLREFAESCGAKNTKYLPTVIDISRYHTDNSPYQKGLSKKITIGWIGSPSTTKYLELVREAIAELSVSFDIKLCTVGASFFSDDRFIVEQYPWNEDTEVSFINTFDIGLMPLESNEWEKGKCGYKLIQYMACGKPVIASAVGVNVDIVLPTVGFLCNDKSDWVLNLTKLIEDDMLRYSMGANSRFLVENFYCTDVSYKTLISEIN